MDFYNRTFSLLDKIYRKGAFASIALKEDLGEDAARVTATVYGVLEHDVTLEYIISKLCPRAPKPQVKVLLKLGIFLARFSDTAAYAAVNNTVELAKHAGMASVSGFINSVLKHAITLPLPEKKSDFILFLSINYSVPAPFAKALADDYGEAEAEKILAFRGAMLTHIRPNFFRTTEQQFLQLTAGYDRSSVGGCYVSGAFLQKNSGNPGIIVQSEASVLCCRACKGIDNVREIFDACAAPGGKSVQLSEMYRDSKITACDIHSHRAELIRAYASKTGAGNIYPTIENTAEFNPARENRYGLVLCDVPCSGTGVMRTKPDILLRFEDRDVSSVNTLQQKILETSSRYVRPGGVLVYSTCSILKRENERVTDAFLASNRQFKYEPFGLPLQGFENTPGYCTLLPHITGTEGFYIARMRRI